MTSSEPPNPDRPEAEPDTPAAQPGPPPPEMAEPTAPPMDMAEPASPPPSMTPPPVMAPPPAATQPAWTPPPAPPAYAGAAAGPGMVARPGMVTGAGITMIVLGSLITLLGLFVLIAGVFVGGAANQINVSTPGFNGLAGAFAGVIIVIALIFLAFGILDIVAGANVLGGRSWARITGIVVAAIFGLLSLPGLFNGNNGGGGPIFGLILVAANAFVIWALATTGSWFAARTR